MNQEEILKIVKKWKIKWKPEYRGFGCAKVAEEIEKRGAPNSLLTFGA